MLTTIVKHEYTIDSSIGQKTLGKGCKTPCKTEISFLRQLDLETMKLWNLKTWNLESFKGTLTEFAKKRKFTSPQQKVETQDERD